MTQSILINVNRHIRSALILLQLIGLLFTMTLGLASQAQTVTYIHTDGLGSPVAKSDAAGNLVANSRTRYEPYGMAVAGTATPTIGFTGHVNDADTGLTYMQQRYYDPVAGRFLSEDPMLTDANSGKSFNRYAYSNNNPYRYIDLDGRDAVDKWGDTFKREMERTNGQSRVFEVFEQPAMTVTSAMAVVFPAIVALDVGVTALTGSMAMKAWKSVSAEQKAAINNFFTGSEKAAQKAGEKVTKETLKKYEKVAERQIKRGKDNNGEQQRRIEKIKDTLKEK